ncbi:hypothetical protein B5807_09059 [Epicoccum nigrum]|uniref:Uncharacterized protein n=1 Tax=Epicoccum nigrum TaxID=105696 RepID=A0A1Y2LUW6_EPING|nr:hypothetical protein B5807_09059 [Epicoccum nigrum]
MDGPNEHHIARSQNTAAYLKKIAFGRHVECTSRASPEIFPPEPRICSLDLLLPSQLPTSAAQHLYRSFCLSPSWSVIARPSRLLEEDIVQRCNNCQTNNRPSSPDNLLVGETDTNIPQQVPHAVERVEEHGEREEALQRHFGSRGPRRDGRDHRGGLKVPSGVGCGEVCETEEVQRAGQRNASDAVERGRVPGDLRAVDGQVGRDGAVQALLAEDLLRGILRGGFGCGEPGEACQWAAQSGWCCEECCGNRWSCWSCWHIETLAHWHSACLACLELRCSNRCAIHAEASYYMTPLKASWAAELTGC